MGEHYILGEAYWKIYQNVEDKFKKLWKFQIKTKLPPRKVYRGKKETKCKSSTPCQLQ